MIDIHCRNINSLKRRIAYREKSPDESENFDNGGAQGLFWAAVISHGRNLRDWFMREREVSSLVDQFCLFSMWWREEKNRHGWKGFVYIGMDCTFPMAQLRLR
jgi:hypothetical protein